MKNSIGMILFLIIGFCIVFGSGTYKYNECKKVGHETFYCIITMGKH